MPDWFGLLDREAALRFLDEIQEFAEDSGLPPEVIKKRLAVIEAIRKAHLFIILFSVVDTSLMNEAKSSRDDYDKARRKWTDSKSHTLH